MPDTGIASNHGEPQNTPDTVPSPTVEPATAGVGEPGGDLAELPQWARAHLDTLTRAAQSWQSKYEAAAPLAQRATELENASKTELQRAQDDAQRFRSEAETATGALARLRVARGAGLADDFAERLVGATPEDLAADAARLAALISPQPSASGGEGGMPRRPIEALTPGDRSEPDTPDITDLGVIGAQMFS